MTQGGKQGNTNTYSDDIGVNARPEDAGADWQMQFPGRDNAVGKNVKTTADWYGEDYLRHLISTGQYNPSAADGEDGYTSGLLTGKGSGTYQIPLNPDSKTMESTTTFQGGEDLDPSTWNKTQKDAWLAANEGMTIEDAISMYNPEVQKYGGPIAKMMYGTKVKKNPYRYGTKVKRYDEGDHVHPHQEPISDNVRQDYHDMYGKNGAGMKKRQINNMLNTLNPSVSDTIFMQPNFEMAPENTESSEAFIPNSSKKN